MDNVFADMLSRLPRAAEYLNRIDNRGNREIMIMRVNVNEKLNLKSKFKDLSTQQQSSRELEDIARNAPEIGSPEATNCKYEKKDNILYKKTGRMELHDREMADEIIRAYHEDLGIVELTRCLLQ